MLIPRTLPTASRRVRCALVSSAACLLAGLWAGAAGAASVPVPNFSFESPAVADGVADFTIPSWTQVGSGSFQAGVYNPTPTGFAGTAGAGNLPAPAAGPQGAFTNTGGIGGVKLVTAGTLATIQPNTTYTLTVALGVRTDFPVAGVLLGNAYVDLLANGSAPVGAALGLDANTLPVGSFQDYSVTFSTGASGGVVGQALTADIGYVATSNSGIMMDNVRLDASSVPEPATLGVLLVGGVALMGRRRREQLETRG